MKPTRDDVALYVMGAYEGDAQAFEAALAEAPELRALLAEEAELELLLRDAASAASFCPACDDLVGSASSGAGAIDRCASCGSAVHPGGYVIERVLVANAHGRMYVARDADATQVALKELAFVQKPGLAAIAAFEREARVLRALEHPAIPRFLAAFEEGEGVATRYYLAQELVTGEALDRRLETHFFTEAEILDIARQVLRVLVYLQNVSPMVIHRDIKPANLIVRADGTIAVVDFGAAHVQGATAGSTSIGTFGYMPIEQLAGIVDATTDVYALGATLVHLATRQEPWRVLQPSQLSAINVSAPLRRYLEKLVAPEPRDRFANAQAALAAIDDLGSLRPRRRPIWRPGTIWRPVLAVLAAALALGGAGIAGYALTDDDDDTHTWDPPVPSYPMLVTPPVTIAPSTTVVTPRITVPGPSTPARAPVPPIQSFLARSVHDGAFTKKQCTTCHRHTPSWGFEHLPQSCQRYMYEVSRLTTCKRLSSEVRTQLSTERENAVTGWLAVELPNDGLGATCDTARANFAQHLSQCPDVER